MVTKEGMANKGYAGDIEPNEPGHTTQATKSQKATNDVDKTKVKELEKKEKQTVNKVSLTN